MHDRIKYSQFATVMESDIEYSNQKLPKKRSMSARIR